MWQQSRHTVYKWSVEGKWWDKSIDANTQLGIFLNLFIDITEALKGQTLNHAMIMMMKHEDQPYQSAHEIAALVASRQSLRCSRTHKSRIVASLTLMALFLNRAFRVRLATSK